MIVIHVFIQVKPEYIGQFREATIKNASASVQESGIARFDVLQRDEEPAKFVLIEVYRNPDAHALHRESAHYKEWRDTVEPMMAEPRTSVKYANVFPGDEGW